MTTASDVFLAQLKSYLEKHKIKEAQALFNDELYLMLSRQNALMWDIISIICVRLKTLNEFRFKTFGACQDLLLKLTDVCNPKEVLIALLAELENENSEMSEENDSNGADGGDAIKKYQSKDNCFKAIMKPLENILIKLPKKRNETLKWVLNTLNNHLLKIPSPKDRSFGPGKERLFLENDAAVKRFNLLLPFYLDFLTAFVNELATVTQSKELKSAANSESLKDVPQREILLIALLSILFHPCLSLDVSLLDKNDGCHKTSDGKTKTNPSRTVETIPESKAKNCSFNHKPVHYPLISSPSSSKPSFLSPTGLACGGNDNESLLCAIKTVELISKLEPNMFNIYENFDQFTKMKECEGSNDFKMKPDAMNYSLAVLSYVTLGLNFMPTKTFVPCVYSHLYRFQMHLPLIHCLMERKESLICEKGLILGEKLVSSLGSLSLDPSFLDCLKQHPLDKTLIKIMRMSSVKAHRQQALRIFRYLIHSFTNPGRYQIIYTTFSEPRQHPGVRGFVLGMYKDLIAKEQDISVFVGHNLQRLVRKAIPCCFPDGPETDLLENSDAILGLLNLIRFLCLRDKKEHNRTTIWDAVDVIQNDFLKPLRKAIFLSRTHYKLELKLEQNKPNKRSTTQVPFEVHSVDGEELPPLPPDHEKQVIGLALNNFDIIESVVVRIEDIINE